MQTIKSKQEFDLVFKKGTRAGSALVRVCVLPLTDNPRKGGLEKVAFVAPKRLGCAVYRNRCKRLLREAVRTFDLNNCGYQVIFFATSKTHDASLVEIISSLKHVLIKSQVLQKSEVEVYQRTNHVKADIHSL